MQTRFNPLSYGWFLFSSHGRAESCGPGVVYSPDIGSLCPCACGVPGAQTDQPLPKSREGSRATAEVPGPRGGKGTGCPEPSVVLFSVPTTTPCCTDVSTKENAGGRAAPLHCIDGVRCHSSGRSFCVAISLLVYLQQRAGNPEGRGDGFQTEWSLGVLGTVRSRALPWGSSRARLSAGCDGSARGRALGAGCGWHRLLCT